MFKSVHFVHLVPSLRRKYLFPTDLWRPMSNNVFQIEELQNDTNTTPPTTLGSSGRPRAKRAPKQSKVKGSGTEKNFGEHTPGRLRGHPRDAPEVRLSKTITWLLRHAAENERLLLQPDGYIKVNELFEHPKLKPQSLTLDQLKEIVATDSKGRFDLTNDEVGGVWKIRATQGHSIKMDMKPVLSLADVPSRVAVHGTTRQAWSSIAEEGLSKMARNHIHLAQGVAVDGVISGMRTSSQVFIYINVPFAIEDGIEFFLSANGVVLTAGNENGFLAKKYFERVEDVNGTVITGWEESTVTIT